MHIIPFSHKEFRWLSVYNFVSEKLSNIVMCAVGGTSTLIRKYVFS